MQHKSFILNAVIVAIISGVSAGAYIYYSQTNPQNIQLHICLKAIPLTMMTSLNVLYMLTYKASTYSIMNLISLILCLFGDIFLSINKDACLYSGAASFLVARILWGINWSIYNKEIIKYTRLRSLFVYLISLICYTGVGFSLIIYKTSFLSGLILVYILIGMPFPLAAAFLRINKLDHESLYGTIFAFTGMFLFNSSDIMLFVYMLFGVSVYVKYVSDIIYWIGIYLLTISLIRTNSELKERSLFFNYVSI